jgi:hypothetical protein
MSRLQISALATFYPEGGFRGFPQFFQATDALKLDHNHFLPNSLQFIIL